MDAFARSRWSPVALAAAVLCWSVGLAAAAPPVRRGAPGRLVARAAVAQHNALRDRSADDPGVVPAEALQPAEEFFPPPDMPADDMPAEDLPIEDEPGIGMPIDEPPVDAPTEDVPPGDMPLEDAPTDDGPTAPPEPMPAEDAPYAATPLTDHYPMIESAESDYYDSDYYEPSEFASCDQCGGGCDSSCDCGDGCAGGCTGRCGCSRCSGGIIAGAEFTFVKPRFNRNVAFTIEDSDDDTFERFTEIEFDYAFDFAPRAWLGYAVGGGRGWRVAYWQYDEEAETASASPPANGFGAITPPDFGDVDIGTAIPTDVFTANSRLNCYTVDLEATHEATRGLWLMGASYGVRFASMQQDYLARTRNAAGTLLGQIDYYRQQRGAGPTLALTAVRPMTENLHMFGTARGSVLFGDTDANFFGGEDQDLATPFNTFRVTTRDDVWSIGEVQVGLRWLARRTSGGWQPFASGAAEGQIWNGAGNATSEDGDLGFVGFTVGIGVLR